MVFIKDLIAHLEFLRMKKLTHDINAYKQQHNINQSDNNYITVYKFLDELLDELASWNNDINALIIDAKNVITIDNFNNQDIIIENKKKLFTLVTQREKTFEKRFYLDSTSFFNVLNNKLMNKLNISPTPNAYDEDGIYNRILLNDFTNISLGDLLTYVSYSLHTIISKVHFYESDIKFYISEREEDANRRKALHYWDYHKEVYLFFSDRLN